MASHNILGSQGEDEAIRYLQARGYDILECNWRYRNVEIDIIAETREHIAIVEVKARTSAKYGTPEESISAAKQKHLIQAANAYAEQNEVNKELQFDVISVIFKPEFRLEHIKEAFYP